MAFKRLLKRRMIIHCNFVMNSPYVHAFCLIQLSTLKISFIKHNIMEIPKYDSDCRTIFCNRNISLQINIKYNLVLSNCNIISCQQTTLIDFKYLLPTTHLFILKCLKYFTNVFANFLIISDNLTLASQINSDSACKLRFPH